MSLLDLDKFQREVFTETLKLCDRINQDIKIWLIDDDESTIAERLARDLLHIGLPLKNLYYDKFKNRPGSGISKYQFNNTCLMEADLIIIFKASYGMDESIKYTSQRKVYFPSIGDYYNNFFNLLRDISDINVNDIQEKFDIGCNNQQGFVQFKTKQIEQEEADKREIMSILGLI